jgi:predicted phosphodiesterase
MKYGILSDCHGNLPGLTRAHEMLKKAGAKKFICLGDIVGYGPNSPRCIDYLKENFFLVLAGNHDHALLEKCSVSAYSGAARQAIELARSQLDSTQIQYLQALPLIKEWKEDGLIVYLTHAHPKDYENWCYFPRKSDFQILGAGQEDCVALCFYGHTHQPRFQISSRAERARFPENFKAYGFDDERGETLVINVGSCGQPRDGDLRVAGVLLDTEQRSFTFLRGEYPLWQVQEDMLAKGMSSNLVERLDYGR